MRTHPTQQTSASAQTVARSPRSRERRQLADLQHRLVAAEHARDSNARQLRFERAAHVINAGQLATQDDDKRGRYRRGRVRTGRAERDYETALRKIGQHVGDLIGGFGLPDPATLPTLQELLRAYAISLTPWAERIAGRMLGEVRDRSLESLRAHSREIGLGVRDLIASPIGDVMRERLADQVELIRSLPIEAGERVQALTLEGLASSTRARAIAQEIARSGEVTENRATLIARTEVSRTATLFVQARAQFAGSTHYIWHCVHDHDVRSGHKAMDGAVCEWAVPPAVMENGRTMYFHAGCIWNCRCWCEPIFSKRR